MSYRPAAIIRNVNCTFYIIDVNTIKGIASNYKPIEELDNGIGNEATQYFGIITNNIQLLRDILGFNEITDGSTPDPRTLNGVAKYASESTNNSISPGVL